MPQDKTVPAGFVPDGFVPDAPPSASAPASASASLPPGMFQRVYGPINEIGKGIVKGAGATVAGLGEMAVGAGLVPGVTPALRHPVFQRTDELTRAENTPQMIGKGLATAAELAAPTMAGARVVNAAIPSKARALGNFARAAAANPIPINVELPGQAGLRVMQLAERGGGNLPRPVSQFLQWITHPDKPQMTYEIARDFSSGLGRLSRNEMARMPPALAYEVAGLHAALKKSVAEAAAKAGKGAEYAKAMTEYARAKRLEGAIREVAEGAKGALPKAIGGGAAGAGAGIGWWLTQKITSLLGDK